MGTHVIGIDLGTTNSCVATLERGHPTVLPNAEGDRTTPSAVSFNEDGSAVVGAPARRQATLRPEQTITSIKRFVGRRLEEVDEEAKTVPYRLVAGESERVEVEINSERFSPEQLSGMIIGKLKADAEEMFGEEVTQAVITVPAYFNDAQRKATKDAAEIAGLEVLRLVNEPTAAALAYGFTSDAEETLLVFDLGGGTFDVSVLDISDSVFQVLATSGDNHLGGDDFDRAIVESIRAEFQDEHGFDLASDAGALQRLYEASEKAKIELSSMPSTQINLPFIAVRDGSPLHIEKTLTRADLDKLCASLIERLRKPTFEAIKAAGLEVGDIDHVILVGGMTRMPAVIESVREMTGRDPRKGVHPDEAVALGAALQAGVLTGDVDDVLLLDVTSLSLGIETKGGVTSKLIEANTTIPTKVSETFTTAEDNQASVEVHVVQGEREMAADNRSLGRVQLMGIPPAIAGIPQVEVTFDLDANGILTVTARDLGTGDIKEARIEATTGLTDEQVKQMRTEAAANRERDAEARRMAETRNASEIAVQQADSVLDGDELSAEERAEIEQARTALNDLLMLSESTLADIEEARIELTEKLQTHSSRLYGDTSFVAPEPSSEALAKVFSSPEEDEEAELIEFDIDDEDGGSAEAVSGD